MVDFWDKRQLWVRTESRFYRKKTKKVDCCSGRRRREEAEAEEAEAEEEEEEEEEEANDNDDNKG